MKIQLSGRQLTSNRSLGKEACFFFIKKKTVCNTGRRAVVLLRGRMCNSNSLTCGTFFTVHLKNRFILKTGAIIM